MSTKIKCLLLDDELPGLAYLRMLCEQIPDVEVVKAFNDAEKFIDSLTSLDYNLCILDIEMPKFSGLDVAKHIIDVPVIFTTAYKEYAVDAFELSAVDYIQKPIQKSRLEKAISKAAVVLNTLPFQKQHAQFNTDKGKTVVMFDEIMYVTSSDVDKRDKIMYLENDQRLTLKNINYEQLLSILPATKFCRVNKRDVIALKAVQHYSYEEVVTKLFSKSREIIKLPLNDTYRAEFKLRFI